MVHSIRPGNKEKTPGLNDHAGGSLIVVSEADTLTSREQSCCIGAWERLKGQGQKVNGLDASGPEKLLIYFSSPSLKKLRLVKKQN